jgi:hypothetical protein
VHEHYTIFDIEDPASPLGAALRECEIYCVSACCGMGAYHINIEHMQRWAGTVSAADIGEARREVDAAIESLSSLPEKFYFLDREHFRSEVSDWFLTIREVLSLVSIPT